MHDYYVDRLVHLDSFEGLSKAVMAKKAVGGGGIHGTSQEDARGGNAVNLANALARLGMRTLLITHSDTLHEPLLRKPFEGLAAELRVKPLPAALTVAFEEKVNVMLGDEKGASDFGPSLLDESDWEALRGSRVVCSVNWAANRQGTKLLLALRRRLGREKTIYLDPADFRDRLSAFAEVLHLIEEKQVVDWLSMNEPEAAAAARLLRLGSRLPEDICLEVARRLGVVFDLHGAKMSFSSEGTRVTRAPARHVKTMSLTGAGDAWDAGAICGRLMGLDEAERLRFANAAAGLYLRSGNHLPPTLEQVREATG
jgi:sugar/nucleoside kinase (ribokinase family)